MMEVSLQRIGAGNPRLEAELLFAHALQCTRISLLMNPDREFSPNEERRLETMLDRRLLGEPLAYVLGTADFMGHILRVGPGVLIPRSETERFVEVVEEELKAGRGAAGTLPSAQVTVLDVGTGSGAIPIALALRNGNLQAVATDISSEALAYARENVKAHGLEERIHLLESDLFDGLGESLSRSNHIQFPRSLPGGFFDAIISNPPYIPAPDMADLPREIRDHEPPLALHGGEDGTDYLMRLIVEAPRYLKFGGLLALEFSSEQAETLSAAAFDSGVYKKSIIVRDLADRDRFLLAWKSPVS
ncbi:MAG: peptide chain release factor N(5)-glutamine methyltransferase [bacterium]